MVGDLAALHGTPNIGGDRSQEGSPLAAADLQPVLPNLDHIVLDRPHIPQIDKVTLVAFGKVVGASCFSAFCRWNARTYPGGGMVMQHTVPRFQPVDVLGVQQLHAPSGL